MTDWPIESPDSTVPPPRTVRCWRVRIDAIGDDTLGRLHDVINREEQARSMRFLRPADRRSFTAAHAGLRLVLSAALERDARDFQFVLGAVGKPMLADRAVEFNLSHSGGIVLIALASGIEIGADVERIRDMTDRAAIARHFLHPGEAAELAALSEAEAERAFFRCWSRKEAVSKSLGLGLSLPLDQFQVSCRPGAPAELLSLEGEEAPADTWSLIDLDPAPTHVGAVAARHRPLTLVRRTLDLAEAVY